MFLLDNLTRAFTAVHSTQYSSLNHSLILKLHFVVAYIYCMNLVALSWAGTQYCSLTPLCCQDLGVPLEAGTHQVTVGFSTVWQPLTTGVPHVLTQAVYCCVRGPNNLSTGLLSCAAFSLTRMTLRLLLYPLRGPLKFISCPSTYILSTK